jgi:hypothetical protein
MPALVSANTLFFIPEAQAYLSCPFQSFKVQVAKVELNSSIAENMNRKILLKVNTLPKVL